MADKHYREYEAYRQKLAESNVTNGVIYEPRAYFETIKLPLPPLNPFEQAEGQGGVFRNGEQFPVVLTHMTAAVSLLEQVEGTPLDERTIQRIGLYMRFHDQYYMAPPQTFEPSVFGVSTPTQIATPVPAWVNTNTATSEAVNRGTSNWRFSRPPILSVRDALRVQVMTPYAIEGTRSVQVTFSGLGILSGLPYQFSGQAQMANTSVVNIEADRYVNDGSEPVMLTDMSVVVLPDSDAQTVVQDSRSVYLSVTHLGNGTSAKWFQTPLNTQAPGTAVALPSGFMGAVNIGQSTGRAAVHEFPQPLIWEPGEGIDVMAQALQTGVASASLQVALLGYIAVQ